MSDVPSPDDTQFRRRVLDSLFAFVGVLTPDGTLTEANRAPFRAVVFGRKLWEYYWFNHDGAVQALVRDVVARAGRGEVARCDVGARMHAARCATIDLMIAPLWNDRGGVSHLVASAVDITDRKRAEDALRASEERLRLAVRAANIGLWDWGLQTGAVTYSPEWKEQLGYVEGEIGNDPGEWENRLHPDDRSAVLDRVRQALDGASGYEAEYRMRHKDGSWRWVHARGEVIRSPGGHAVRMLGCHLDETERKRTEEVRTENQDRLALAIGLANLGLYDRDSSGQTVADPRVRELFGVPADLHPESIYEFWVDRIHPDDVEHVTDLRRQLIEDGFERCTVEYRYRHPERGWVWLSHAVRITVREPGRWRSVGVVKDITERKQVEEELARQAAILEAAPDFVATATPDGRIVYMNRALTHLVGALGEADPGAGTLVRLHPGWAARVVADEGIPTAVRVGTWSGETALRAPDGREIPTSQAIIAHRNRRGEVIYLSTILRDLTPSKELEREVSRAAVEEQQRIGQELHDGVGQELTGLALMLDTLEQRLRAAGSADAKLVGTISAGLQRVREEVRELSRGLVPVVVDGQGLRAALEDLAAQTRRSGVACAFECAGDAAVTDTTVATHLFRIAQEAVGNALRHARAAHISLNLQDAGNQITLTVRDDGVGIPGARATAGAGRGLQIMKHRAGVIGGGVEVLSGPGGTRVVCTVRKGARHD
jgi:PAS domain S-box-containing protein